MHFPLRPTQRRYPASSQEDPIRYRNEERLRALRDAHGQARGHGRASDRLGDIASALAQSRVGTLLVAADRRIPGSVGATQGTVSRTDDGQAGAPAVLRHQLERRGFTTRNLRRKQISRQAH